MSLFSERGGRVSWLGFEVRVQGFGFRAGLEFAVLGSNVWGMAALRVWVLA